MIHRFVCAIEFAAQKHAYQTRKTGGSYITHPIAVVRLLTEVGVADPDVLAAAVLHDTVEDTDTTIDEIKEKFGATVARYVGEVTDDKTLPKAKRKQEQVAHAKTSSNGAFMIKMADAYDNLSGLRTNPPPTWDAARVKGYFVWKKAVISARGASVNKALEDKLANLFEQVISKDDDEEALLRDYYASMETCGEK